MDPLSDLRAPEAELRGVDPLDRARLAMEREETAEQRQARQAADADRERFAQRLAVQDMHDRTELAGQGFLSREVERYRAEQEQLRRGRIAELREELARLEGRGEFRAPGASDVEAELARNAAEAEAWRSPAITRMREWSLQAEISRSRGGSPAPRPAPPAGHREVTRVTGSAVVSVGDF